MVTKFETDKIYKHRHCLDICIIILGAGELRRTGQELMVCFYNDKYTMLQGEYDYISVVKKEFKNWKEVKCNK